MITLSVSSIRNALIGSLSSNLQLNYADSEITIDHLIRCEQYGKADHGLTRFPYLISSEKFGSYQYQSSPEMKREKQGTIFTDGTGYIGYPIISHMIQQGCIDAKKNTSCFLLTKSVYPSGALLYWAQMAIENGCGIILMANSPARMTSPGGLAPITGTNPLCIGLPTDDLPFIADFSASEITHGTLLQSRNEGIPLPPNSAINADGTPCTDGNSVFPAKGIGAILPFGNSYKSFALGLAIELLACLGGNTPGSFDKNQQGIFGIVMGPELINMSRPAISNWLESLTSNNIRIPGFESYQRFKKFEKSGTVEISEKLHHLIKPYIS